MSAPAIAKRWQDRAQRWVAPGPLFIAARYAVDVLDKRAETHARRFVERHHYSASYVASRLAVGLFGPRAELVGVAVFSEPITRRVVPAWTGFGAAEGAELGRFVLAPSVAYNGETWLLARAFRALRAARPELRAIVSYADPLERTTLAGASVKPQHWGTIYQASNAIFAGRSSPRTQVVAPCGRIVSGRMLTKIRRQERGSAYAERQLVAFGAPPREFGEHPSMWVRRALTSPEFRRVRHPGNLAYVFGLDVQATAAVREHNRGGLQYPRPMECAA